MKLWKYEKDSDNAKRCGSLWESFGLERYPAPCVIAVCGSGGKTSLLGRLAREGTERKKRVAVLTTTHMKKPPGYREVFSGVGKGEALVYGIDEGHGKIVFPGETCYHEILAEADIVLIEADGSRGLPLKAPSPYEPVIPKEADLIVVVAGLSGLGQRLSAVCHRWELAGKLAEKVKMDPPKHGTRTSAAPLSRRKGEDKDRIVSEQMMALLLKEGYGNPMEIGLPKARTFFCLNQADTDERKRSGEHILKRLSCDGVVLSLLDEINPLYEPQNGISMLYLASGFSRRFGSNKLLHEVKGKPLFQHGLDCLQEAVHMLKREGVKAEIIVVSQYREIIVSAAALNLKRVYNSCSSQGITASIRLGVLAAPCDHGLLFAVADQPWLKPGTIVELVKKYQSGSRTIACLASHGKRGNPALFAGCYRKELLSLRGDKGGSQLIKQYPGEVLPVEAEPEELRDVDMPGEL